MARRLRLRITDGSKRVELSADIDSLTHQIVNVSDETLSPNVLIEAGRRWLPLKDYPDAPWLDQLASRAAKAIQAGDVEACDVAASRVLRFAGKRQSEAVSVAHLLVGHLRFVDGRLQEAVSAWQQATRSKTAVRAVAYENMGVAWRFPGSQSPRSNRLIWRLPRTRTSLWPSSPDRISFERY